MSAFIPSADELNGRTFDISNDEEELVARVISSVENKLPKVQVFASADEVTQGYFRLTILNIIRWLVKSCAWARGQFWIPIMDDDRKAYYILHRRRVLTFIRILKKYIIFNLSTSGVLTEYWSPITYDFIVQFMQINDAIYYPGTSMQDIISDTVELTFEENREQVVDKLYGEHQDHELTFSSMEPVPRTEENAECQLCCSDSDYICEKCGEPLCLACIGHLKHSTNSCPACRTAPIVLRLIEGGNEYKTNN